MGYKENYNAWLNDKYFDEKTRAELAALGDDDREIEERFFKSLEFGTGGLRGVMGAGTNRMNIYTVRIATQGLANYILLSAQNGAVRGVAIAYDSRRLSREFAEEAAHVLNGNGIKSYIFDDLRPTPMLSFAIRHLGCAAGIVVTASHNPPEYNGYKAYWEDGAQIPYPRDGEIIQEVNKITEFTQIRYMARGEAEDAGLFNIIPKKVDDAFTENVKAQTVNAELIARMADRVNIVYTPINGSGNRPVRRVLAELGYKNVHVVPEQENPDPDFTTVGYPNPEDVNVFKLAIELAKKVEADVIIGTDPDCDRVGALIKSADGEYAVMTGNMTGALLEEYILTQRRALGALPQNPAVVSTIVSTRLAREIAEENGVAYYDVLTGFKYIGEKIKQFEQSGEHSFVFGFEESYGCLSGTYARDKDAVVATMLICELVAFFKQNGLTLYDGLQELYRKYGYYKESVQSITLKGIEGLQSIGRVMANLRAKPPKAIGMKKTAVTADYLARVKTTLGPDGTAAEEPITLPAADVLHYTLADGSWACVRPSGTEPKLKIYFGVRADTRERANAALAKLTKAAMALVDGAMK